MHTDPETSQQTWVDQATQYARRYGWKIVPLDPESGVDATVDDPVVRQLGAIPLVDYPGGATARPAEIDALGKQYPDAEIGALTGKASGLLAVELKGGGDDTLFHERIEEVARGTSRVVAPNREYILFPYPDLDDPLPAVTEKSEAVLHGDGSVVYLPWTRYEWKDRFLDEERVSPRVVAQVVLSLFGLEAHLPLDEDGEQGAARGRGERGAQPDDERTQLDLPLRDRSSNGTSDADDSSPFFRSGDQLAPTDGDSFLNLPWTVPGGLSVLTGPPKTAGKSTWTLNLAAHLAAGEPFLGFDPSPSKVVLMADTSPPNLRGLLGEINVLGAEARSRLHVLHSCDVSRLDWGSTLARAYEHATTIGARLLIVDCLDRYVALKGGGAPTDDEDVAHMLTAGAPESCSVLAVKSTTCGAQESLSRTIRRLGMLGRSADAILRLDDVSTERRPCLRRLLTVSRAGSVSATHLCALQRGRYERVRRSDVTGRGAPASPAAPLDELLAGGANTDQLLPN